MHLMLMHQMQPGNPSQSAPARWPMLVVIGLSAVMFGWSLCRQPSAVSNFFIDGTPLTGQSDHLVNLLIGLEDTDRLSQQTLLLSREELAAHHPEQPQTSLGAFEIRRVMGNS